MALPFWLSIYWGVGIWEKLAISAISPLFFDDQKCIEMLYIYEIEMTGLYGLPIF
jgi:hypothetical protein